jgi:AcrR family transcriptional regulator
MARPRNKPESEALEAALYVFWEKGYDRTSLADLSVALGVGPSGIYNAFGSKAELFRRSMQRYLSEYASFVPELLGRAQEEGLELSLREILRRAVELYSTKGQPSGCAMLEGGGADRSKNSEGGCIAKKFSQELEDALRGLFEGAGENEPLSNTPRILAKYILGVMRGLSQLARDGTSRKDLIKIADHAVSSCITSNSSN